MLEARSVPKPIWERFWTDFGPIWERFWSDFGAILDRFWIDFGSMFDKCPYGASGASGVRSYHLLITYLLLTYHFLVLACAVLVLACACLCLRMLACARLCLLVCLLEISHIPQLASDFFSSLYTRTRFPFIVSQVWKESSM